MTSQTSANPHSPDSATGSLPNSNPVAADPTDTAGIANTVCTTLEDGLAATAFYSGEHYVIEESIGYLIRRSHVALQQDIDALMQVLDLTAMQWGPLLFISHGKGDTAADIARCGGSDTGAMTRMLDRLEAKGLVARKRSSDDRRVVHLELSEAGKQIAEKIPHVLAECMNKRLQGFTQQEVDTFKSLLRRLLDNDSKRNEFKRADSEDTQSMPGTLHNGKEG